MDKSKELIFLIKEYLNNIFVRTYFIGFFILRIALSIISMNEPNMSSGAIFTAFVTGLLSDLVMSFFWMPIILLFQQFNILRPIGHFIFNIILTLTIAAQIFFWFEYKGSFNFVAVTYLLNITQINSAFENNQLFYIVIFTSFVLSALVSFFTLKFSKNRPSRKLILAMIVSALAIGPIYNSEQIGPTNNKYAHEISKNSHFELMESYFDGNINYLKFYPTRSSHGSLDLIRKKVIQKDSFFISQENLNRNIASNKPFTKKNIILIMMDGIGAKDLAFFGKNEQIMPNLNKIQEKGLFFSNFYATSIDSLRGIESTILSIPPLPGNSLIKRKKSRNLYNIGTAFRDNGYITDFIHGTYSFTNSLDSFLILNNFTLTDKSNFLSDEIKNFNPFYISDEDVFSKILKKSDARDKRNKSFFSIIKTNRGKIPSEFSSKVKAKNDNELYAKYVDYSIGKFLEEAKNKSWFKDTIFIFTSSHLEKKYKFNELDHNDFHIPLILYSPEFIEPNIISDFASQIDIGPTILGILNFSYRSKAFGQDLLKNPPKRALISTYQTLGYIDSKNLIILNPNTNPALFSIYDGNKILMDTNIRMNNIAISYYQTAYELFDFGEMIDGI